MLGRAECGEEVGNSCGLLPSTEEAYEVLESYDWFAIDEALNDPSRGEDPMDDVLAWCCGGGASWENEVRSPNEVCGAYEAEGH